MNNKHTWIYMQPFILLKGKEAEGAKMGRLLYIPVMCLVLLQMMERNSISFLADLTQ